METKFSWENPFGEEEQPATVLWTPTAAVAAVSLKAIKARQKKLLSPIHQVRRTAIQVLRRIGNETGGAFFLQNTERPVMVEVLFRRRRRLGAGCRFAGEAGRRETYR